MQDFKRIVVPTDFSPASESALEAASALAIRYDAEILLLHVFDLSPFVAPTAFAVAAVPDLDLQKEVRLNAQESLKNLQAKFFAPPIKASADVFLEASAVEGVCRYAKEHHADLIVMATHGRTGLSHVLIGSVTERVVRHAPCPVLVVRPIASKL